MHAQVLELITEAHKHREEIETNAVLRQEEETVGRVSLLFLKEVFFCMINSQTKFCLYSLARPV